MEERKCLLCNDKGTCFDTIKKRDSWCPNCVLRDFIKKHLWKEPPREPRGDDEYLKKLEKEDWDDFVQGYDPGKNGGFV